MSRHRNVRKLNIEEELQEDDDDDFYDFDEEPISPETAEFIYQRPSFAAFEEQQTANKQFEPKKPEEQYYKEEYGPNEKTFFQVDEAITVIRPKKNTQQQSAKTSSQQHSQTAKSSPVKQPTVAVPPAVENLRIEESAKVRSSSKSPGRTATPKQSNLEVALAAIPKYRKQTRSADEYPALNLVIVGHVDAGKSTLVGHLLYLLGNVDSRTMHRMHTDSSRMGKSSFAFAWILDDSEEERKRGVTMDIARTSFESPSGRKFTILDAPGHKDFIPNMISGASQADFAVLVVNATRGEFETGFDQGGQTREHALLVRALGVSRLVVAVNKLDTCDWAQQRFDELCAILSTFLLKRAGFEQVFFVPVSGLLGVNLLQKPSPEHPLAAWNANGPTLLETLESLPLAVNSAVDQPLRIVVNDVLKYATTNLVLNTKVECGHVEPGDKLFLMPEANPVIVKAISIDEPFDTSNSASASALSSSTPTTTNNQICFAGDQATLQLAGTFEPDSVFPGHVLCRGGSELLMPCRHFTARLVTFDIRIPILKGTRAELFVHSLRVPCVFTRLIVMHPGGKELEKRNPRLLPRNTSAIVEISTDQFINLEPFNKSKQLGRIALRAGGETIAAGIVLDQQQQR